MHRTNLCPSVLPGEFLPNLPAPPLCACHVRRWAWACVPVCGCTCSQPGADRVQMGHTVPGCHSTQPVPTGLLPFSLLLPGVTDGLPAGTREGWAWWGVDAGLALRAVGAGGEATPPRAGGAKAAPTASLYLLPWNHVLAHTADTRCGCRLSHTGLASSTNPVLYSSTQLWHHRLGILRAPRPPSSQMPGDHKSWGPQTRKWGCPTSPL